MKRALFILFFMFILGCGTRSQLIISPTGYSIDTITEESPYQPEIYFCPRDNCSFHLVNHINNAKESVHCAFFDLRLPDVINAMKNNAIDVKIIVDDENYKYVDSLEFVRKDTSSQLSHNKFCIFDRNKVWTGSFNPTERGNFKNNNNVIVYDSEHLAINFEEEFQELWDSRFGRGDKVRYPIILINNKKIENYFCPEDGCAKNTIKTLKTANKSIYFMVFSFTHEDIGNTLIRKHRQGVDIKGVFEKTQDTKWSERSFLSDEGIDARTDSNPANMHHKVFIIDEKIVITGSFNPSKNADTRNDENILIIHDKNVAKMYLEEFWRVFTS